MFCLLELLNFSVLVLGRVGGWEGGGGPRVHPGFSCFSRCQLQMTSSNKFQRGLESHSAGEGVHRPRSCGTPAVVQGERGRFSRQR